MIEDVAEIERKAVEEMAARKAEGQLALKAKMNALFDILMVDQADRSCFYLDHQFLAAHGDAYIVQMRDASPPAHAVTAPVERNKLN